MRRAALLAFVLLLSLSATCGEKDEALFPPIQGWTLLCDSTVYTRETLWEYIDGAADLFVSYGFQDLHIAYYRSSPDVEIRVESYRHGSSENAYGIYSQERSPDNPAAAYGAEGYADEGLLNFVAGPWYMKLSSNQSGDQVRRGLGQVAGAIDSTLAQPHRLPVGFDLLPSRNRTPRSEQYIARDYLGYKFLTGAYVATYGPAEGCQVFVIPKGSPAAAKAVRDAFVRVAPNESWKAGNPFLRLRDPHHGPIELATRGKYVVGILGCPESKNLRLEILKNLK